MRKSTKTNDGITAIYVRRSVSDKKTVVAILTNPEIKEAKTIQMIKATPHDPCASDAPSRFSSDCLNSTQAC